MNTEQLNKEAAKWAADYLSREKLGSDEELQMLSAAYAQLFLTACENKPKELGPSHNVIADCFKKLGDEKWEARHRQLAKAYEKQN